MISAVNRQTLKVRKWNFLCYIVSFFSLCWCAAFPVDSTPQTNSEWLVCWEFQHLCAVRASTARFLTNNTAKIMLSMFFFHILSVRGAWQHVFVCSISCWIYFDLIVAFTMYIIMRLLLLSSSLLFFALVLHSQGFYRAACNADAVLWWDFCLSVCPSVRPSVRPSVCQTRDLWQNGRKIGPDFYTIRKNI